MTTPQIYFTIATAGHVDHGKTSVLRALTGIDPDRLKEEKLRQMTTDLGFAHLRLAGTGEQPDFVVGFIDVPGHGKFLKNMLAGVGGIEMALLVVAADEGPMPQTLKHVKILSLLGVRNALLVLSKVDVASESQRKEALSRTETLLNQYAVKLLDVVLVSSPSGTGLDQLKVSLRRVLEEHGLRHSAVEVPAYLPIDRVFSKAGHGMVVTGTLVRGEVGTGDSVFIEPGGLRARVRGLETFGHQLQKANAGQRLALNLTFKEHVSLARGQTILSQHVAPVNTLLVQLTITGDDEDAQLEQGLAGQQVRLYHGTSECFGQVPWVERVINTDNKESVLLAQLSLVDPVVAEPGEHFVLRYGDQGVTGGVILINNRPRWLIRSRILELAQRLSNAQWAEAVSYYVQNSPQRLVTEESLGSFIPRERRAKLVQEMYSNAELVLLGGYLSTAPAKEQLVQKLLNELTARQSSGAHDEKFPSLETLRGKVMPGVDRAAFQALVRELSESGRVVRQGDGVSLPEVARDVSRTGAHAQLGEKILKILHEHLCLEIDELAKQLDADKKNVVAALNELSKSNRAQVINYEYASRQEAVDKSQQALTEIWQKKREISPADFRDALGTTRKYAMALLAYFDDRQITRRHANSRVLLKAYKAE